jgi:hypothetical protein
VTIAASSTPVVAAVCGSTFSKHKGVIIGAPVAVGSAIAIIIIILLLLRRRGKNKQRRLLEEQRASEMNTLGRPPSPPAEQEPFLQKEKKRLPIIFPSRGTSTKKPYPGSRPPNVAGRAHDDLEIHHAEESAPPPYDPGDRSFSPTRTAENSAVEEDYITGGDESRLV